MHQSVLKESNRFKKADESWKRPFSINERSCNVCVSWETSRAWLSVCFQLHRSLPACIHNISSFTCYYWLCLAAQLCLRAAEAELKRSQFVFLSWIKLRCFLTWTRPLKSFAQPLSATPVQLPVERSRRLHSHGTSPSLHRSLDAAPQAFLCLFRMIVLLIKHNLLTISVLSAALLTQHSLTLTQHHPSW